MLRLSFLCTPDRLHNWDIKDGTKYEGFTKAYTDGNP
jgi:hypothetical protein